MKKILFGILGVFLFTNCNNTIQEDISVIEFVKYNVQGEAQGTYYSITYFDNEKRDLKNQFDSLFRLFDMSASNYQEQSIISKVNRNEPVELDEIFLGNYNIAMKIAEQTNGDFDITVRPLVEAWGFGSRKAEDMDSNIVDSILQFIGYEKIDIQGNSIIKEDPRVQLDFDAVAQGYSVDFIASYMEGIGIERYLVDVGGEVFASKEKTDSTQWNVGIEKPKENANYGEGLSAILPLSGMGMATSGNYRKFYVKDGVKYSHTINPHTGYPVAQTLLSATVIATTAAYADAYATTFMVMGLEKSKEFVKLHPELEVYLIYSDSTGEYQYFSTEGVEAILE